MLNKIIGKLTGKVGGSDIDGLTADLTTKLDLPAVYKPELIHKSSGRKAAGSKAIAMRELSYDHDGPIASLRADIERAYEDDDLSLRIVSPTDKDGVNDRTHLKTLRDGT